MPRGVIFQPGASEQLEQNLVDLRYNYLQVLGNSICSKINQTIISIYTRLHIKKSTGFFSEAYITVKKEGGGIYATVSLRMKSITIESRVHCNTIFDH